MAAAKNDDEKDDAAKDALSAKARQQLKRGRLSSLSDKLTGGPERPGEQKIGRSPVVLLLTGTTIGAFVLAAIFWVINARNQEDRLFKEANASLEQQKYLDAEVQFSKFLQNYPKTQNSPAAKIGLHRSRVEKLIFTNTPDVIKGMQEMQTMITECGELPGFDGVKDNMRRYADRLAYAGAIVAEVAASAEALEVSRKAVDLLRRYSGEAGIPTSREQFLVERQRIAEGAIAKKLDFKNTLDQIKALLEKGDTIGAVAVRQALIDKYSSLKDDKDVQKMLTDILNREKEFVVRSDLGRDGLKAEAATEPLPSQSLALRTQAASDFVSQGRFVYAIGLDSCFSLDAETGDPRWKRTIGVDSPFAPVVVKGSETGILVYSTLAEELQLLAEADGHIIWRQSLESRPTAAPLIVSDTIYVTTENNELWQIASVNGRAQAKLKFSQPVYGPPALSSDSTKMVLPGDQTLVYTISLNPFSCLAVSHIPHRTGSVGAPMLSAGRYFLMVDNDTAEKARVQTLQQEADGSLTIVASDSVDGQVHDPCLLRGYELFVPSTPQRVTAFRVGDDPGQQPLSLVGANQLEEGTQTDMFLLAGPGGQVWLAGRDLRRLQTKTNSVELDTTTTAEGFHVRPIQLIDESVFLTTRSQQADLSSTFFTRTDREQMRGIWRTVLGSRIVAMTPATGGESLLALTDYGESYRIPVANLGKSGFVLDTVSQFRLPEKLSSTIEGLVLSDGRPAAWCGTPEPSMWTFTTTGQLERRWTLPDPPQVAPAVIDAGAVFAMPGRLHLSGMTGGKTAEDYRLTQTSGDIQPWKCVVAISGTQVLGITSQNEFIKVEYRPTPKPQLAELSVTKVPQVVELPPAVADGFLFVPTTDGKLLLMQASTLEILAEKDLGGVATATPKVAGGFVFVEVGGVQAKVFRIEESLPDAGALPLEGFALAGNPVAVEGGIVVARTDGLLTRLNTDGAPSNAQLSIGQAIQSGIRQVNGQLVVVGFDGSLYSVNPSLAR